jgi:hypothetical protein
MKQMEQRDDQLLKAGKGYGRKREVWEVEFDEILFLSGQGGQVKVGEIKSLFFRSDLL